MHPAPVRSRRWPNVPGSAEMLEPTVMPRSCVHASQGDPACVLIVHHLRALSARAEGRSADPGDGGAMPDASPRLHVYPLVHILVATEAPEQLAQGAAILGVHPELSVPEVAAIAMLPGERVRRTPCHHGRCCSSRHPQ